MPARGEHEHAPATEQLGGPVGRRPRDEVVGGPADDVGIALHGGEVDGGPEHVELAGEGQGAVDEDVEEVRVHAAGRRVVSAFQ